MSKKIKKYIFPGTALAASLYASGSFALGAVLGYITTEIFCRKLFKKGKMKPVLFNLKGWEVHLHHWIVGILIFLGAWYFDIIYSVPVIFIGALGGLIFHDIHTDKKWAKVVGESKPWYRFVRKNPR